MKELREILWDLYEDAVDDLPVSKAVMTIDQIVWCPIDEKDEATELARTVFPFIAQVIAENGRPKNRYVITWEVTK